MKRGTHNSATGGRLVWWLRPLAWIINPTSKCQDRSITGQLVDGVKVFNLQVAYVNGEWRFSHGLAVYKEDVFDTLELMKRYASPERPIFFQLHLDSCVWCKKSVRLFIDLVERIKKEYCDERFVMHEARVQGSDICLHRSAIEILIEEHYWTMGWVKSTKPKRMLDKLPLPKYHAKKYNKLYKKNCKSDYLMLDFYSL